MPHVTITSCSAISNPPGSQVTITGTWSDAESVAIQIKCQDDQGGATFVTVPASGDPAIVLAADGTFSVTFDSPCGCGKPFRLTAIARADGDQFQYETQFLLDCGGTVDACCPKPGEVSVVVTVDPGCTSDCKRLVSVTVGYHGTARPDCPALAAMQVSILNLAGTTVATWPVVFSVPLGGSATYPMTPTMALDPGVGYQAVVVMIVNGAACPAIAAAFDVLGCDLPPLCPTHLTLAAYDIGCSVGSGGDCLPTAQFVIAGTFGLGCGSLAETGLLVDFGDGNPAFTVNVAAAGSQQVVLNHQYSSGGLKTAQVTIVNPAGCSPAIVAATVNLHQCSASDCVTCGDPPEPPAWCLCKSCWLFSRKPGRGVCKLIMLVVIALIAIGTLGVLHGFVFAPPDPAPWITATFIISSLGMAFYLDFYSDYCGNCCAACAIWPGIILGILLSVILWLSGTPPVLTPTSRWFWMLLVMLFAGAALYFRYNAACAQEEAEQLGPDDWCKEAQ